MTANDLGALLPLLLLAVMLVFLVRTSRSRQRAAADLQARLAPGQEIMTTAGLYGTVLEVGEEDMVLETTPGTRVRWAKAAVGRIVEPRTPGGLTTPGEGPVTG